MRIASLSPALTEILFALGLESSIVCVDQYSDTPEGAREIPHLTGHVEVRSEDITIYQPEIVLTQTLVQKKLHQRLKQEGFGTRHWDPRSLKEIYDVVLDLGAFFDRMKEARALVTKVHNGFSAVRKKASRLTLRQAQGDTGRVRLYVEEWHHPPMVSGNWVPEVVRIAGGEPFPLPARAPSREVSLEEIQTFDPDLIVISICGAGRFAEKSLLTSRPGWGDLRSVREDHLFVIDDSLLNRPGPRLVEGAQRLYGWIFQVLH